MVDRGRNTYTAVRGAVYARLRVVGGHPDDWMELVTQGFGVYMVEMRGLRMVHRIMREVGNDDKS